MKLRVVTALESLQLANPTGDEWERWGSQAPLGEQTWIDLYQRSRLSDAPDGPHLELACETMAELVRVLFPPSLCRELRRYEPTESAVLVVVGFGRLLSAPIKPLGGMYDVDGLDPDCGGNGWGQLLGAARGHRRRIHRQPTPAATPELEAARRPRPARQGELTDAYSASYTRRCFSRQLPLWIPDTRRLEITHAHGWTNYRCRVDGTRYDSTGRTYPRIHARMRRYFSAEVWRLCIGQPVVGRIVTALLGGLARQDRIGSTLRAMKLQAKELHRERESRLQRDARRYWRKRNRQREREVDFARQIQWSKRERRDAADRQIRLPNWRRQNPHALSKREPVLDDSTVQSMSYPAKPGASELRPVARPAEPASATRASQAAVPPPRVTTTLSSPASAPDPPLAQPDARRGKRASFVPKRASEAARTALQQLRSLAVKVSNNPVARLPVPTGRDPGTDIDSPLPEASQEYSDDASPELPWDKWLKKGPAP